MDKDSDKRLIRLLKYVKLPNFNKICIQKLKYDENQDIDGLLHHSFPCKLQYFYISTCPYIKDPCLIKIDKYMDALIKCISKVSNEISIHNFIIDSSELNDIIKHSYNCLRVRICNCIIVNDAPFDFNIHQTYTTKFLCFYRTGRYDRSKWDGSSKKQLTHILSAVAKSGLKHSLTDINLCECDCKVDQIQTIVNDLGMSHVTVSDKSVYLQC